MTATITDIRSAIEAETLSSPKKLSPSRTSRRNRAPRHADVGASMMDDSGRTLEVSAPTQADADDRLNVMSITLGGRVGGGGVVNRAIIASGIGGRDRVIDKDGAIALANALEAIDLEETINSLRGLIASWTDPDRQDRAVAVATGWLAASKHIAVARAIRNMLKSGRTTWSYSHADKHGTAIRVTVDLLTLLNDAYGHRATISRAFKGARKGMLA
jgi:hypothetical protein